MHGMGHPFMMEPEDYIWVTDFDDISLERFTQKFMRLERDPAIQVIPIYISSYGGEAYALGAMRDLIKSSTKPVSTIAVGKAMSCGVFLLAAGTKGLRFASENTEIMIHEVASGEWGKATEMIQAAADLDRLNKKFFKNFADDIGQSPEFIQAEMDKRKNVDWYLDAKQALKLGVIDDISIPRVGYAPGGVTLAVARIRKVEAEEPVKKKAPRRRKS